MGCWDSRESPAPPDEQPPPRNDPNLHRPFAHVPLVLTLPLDAPHVGLRPLPYGIAWRPLALGHLVQALLGGPAEVDPLSLRLPQDPPNLFASSRTIDGLPW